MLFEELQYALYNYTPRSFYEPASNEPRQVTGMS
jgi:hypothetical protein